MKSDIAGDVHIGVDVSKAKLDVYVPATKEGARPTTVEVDNAVEGFRKLRDMARKAKAMVCVEPTGGYELELVAFLHRSGVAVAYADALRVRQFARAEGCLSKSDAVDAALISRFADRIGVRPLERRDVESVELRRKAKFRQTLTDARTAMVCRLETEVDGDMRAMLREQVRHLDRLIAKAERSCLETIAGNEAMSSLHRRFVAVGGVGDMTAISVLAGLPEIGKLPDAKPDRLVGIAPEESRPRRGRAAPGSGSGGSGAGGRTCATRSTWPPWRQSCGTTSWERTTAGSARRGIPTSGPSSRPCESCCRC